jgi:hypothetical protein
MKYLVVAAALLASVPALAITATGGTVNSAASVSVDTVTDSKALSDSAVGLPMVLASGRQASVNDANGEITAFSSIGARWDSATKGDALLSWGWNAANASGNSSIGLSTQNAPNANWSYSFTTGANAATFNADWTLTTSGNTFGMQGIYSLDSSLPFNITPFILAPGNAAGSFSQALAANTAYTLTFTNFGNLTSASAANVGLVSFQFDWEIVESGGVPEPTSWAMLIAGFGLVGATARRRRSVTA